MREPSTSPSARLAERTLHADALMGRHDDRAHLGRRRAEPCSGPFEGALVVIERPSGVLARGGGRAPGRFPSRGRTQSLARYARPNQLSLGCAVLSPIRAQRIHELESAPTSGMCFRGSCRRVWRAIADGHAHRITVARERNGKFGVGVFHCVGRELVNDELGSLG